MCGAVQGVSQPSLYPADTLRTGGHLGPSKISRTSHLVPEEEIRLTELKLLNVELLHEWEPHDVEAREDPTPPWRRERRRLKMID